jgi:hypothetical protein
MRREWQRTSVFRNRYVGNLRTNGVKWSNGAARRSLRTHHIHTEKLLSEGAVEARSYFSIEADLQAFVERFRLLS